MRRSRPAPVQSITAAPVAHSDDVSRRLVRYLITMGIRTVCIVVAVATTGTIRWIAIAGAVALPYLAVIAANAAVGPGPGASPAGPSGQAAAEMAALPPGVAERVWPSRFAPAAAEALVLPSTTGAPPGGADPPNGRSLSGDLEQRGPRDRA